MQFFRKALLFLVETLLFCMATKCFGILAISKGSLANHHDHHLHYFMVWYRMILSMSTSRKIQSFQKNKCLSSVSVSYNNFIVTDRKVKTANQQVLLKYTTRKLTKHLLFSHGPFRCKYVCIHLCMYVYMYILLKIMILSRELE